MPKGGAAGVPTLSVRKSSPTSNGHKSYKSSSDPKTPKEGIRLGVIDGDCEVAPIAVEDVMRFEGFGRGPIPLGFGGGDVTSRKIEKETKNEGKESPQEPWRLALAGL